MRSARPFSPNLVIPDENGVIAVTNLEVDNRPFTGWLEHYTFSFVPED